MIDKTGLVQVKLRYPYHITKFTDSLQQIPTYYDYRKGFRADGPQGSSLMVYPLDTAP